MLLLQTLREEREKVLDGLRRRTTYDHAIPLVDEVIELDDRRKALQTQTDSLNSQVNAASKEIGALYKAGKPQEAQEIKDKVSGFKEEIKELDEQAREVKAAIEDRLLALPNIPHPSVPSGKSEEDNLVEKDWNKPFPHLPAKAFPHWDLAEQYDLIDFALGAQITGSGFPLFRGYGAKLSRALVQFFLDEAGNAGYEEIAPPLLVNATSARATGQLPDKEGQMYHVTGDDLYLIPTSEVPVTNIVRGKTLAAEDLPIKFTAYTPCFRREAGSYGADVKGLNRVHQFEKVEIVQICHPERSYEALKEMVDHVASLLEKLELPYRILRLCGGDLGFTSALTFDFEVYSTAQQRWLEVSSVSNFETYQANRLQLKFKEKGEKKGRLAHTLNGSALALARIVAALLENNQRENGINIPTVLRKYTGFDSIPQKLEES